jgi:hypothetical protein
MPEFAFLELAFAKTSLHPPSSLLLHCFFLWLGLVPLPVAEVCDDFLPSPMLPFTHTFFLSVLFSASSLDLCENVGMLQSLSEVPRRPSLSIRTTEDGCYLKSQGDDVPSVLEVLTRCPWLPYSYPSLPTILPLSRCLRDAFAMFSLEVLGPWSFPTVARAFRSSAELRSLPRSSLVFSEVLQSPPEFLLVRRSSSLSAGVPPCPPEFLLVRRSSSLSAGVPAASLEPLSLGVLRSSSARLPLSSEGFPLLSYDAAIAS